MLCLLSQEGGTPRRRTRIRWSATIQKPISGPCVPPWRSGATGLALLSWTGRFSSWGERKVGTGESQENVYKCTFDFSNSVLGAIIFCSFATAVITFGFQVTSWNYSFATCFRYHDTIERYCEDTDTWEIVGEMTTSRSWLSCVSLQLRKDIHVNSCTETPNDSWARGVWEVPIFPGRGPGTLTEMGLYKAYGEPLSLCGNKGRLSSSVTRQLSSFSTYTYCICFGFWRVNI